MLTFGRQFFGLGALTPQRIEPATTKPTSTTTASGPTPGVCTPDGTKIWATAADGSGYWRRKMASDVCKGTYDPSLVTAPAPAASLACSPDGQEYMLDVASMEWKPTGRTCTPTASPTTPPTSSNTVTNPYGSGNMPTGGGGGISVGERLSERTLYNKRILLANAIDGELLRRAVALAPTLGPTPVSAIGEDGSCYGKQHISLFSLVNAPGSFEVFQVPFHLSELTERGRFEKDFFVPTPEQRFLMDYAIVWRSRYEYRGYDGVKMSMKTAMQNRPDDFRTFVDGFSLNPVQPTEAEMTAPDGYQTWRARGGYPISLAVLRGKVNVTGYGDTAGFPITTCASIKAACPVDSATFDNSRTDIVASQGFTIPAKLAADQEVHAMPTCIRTSITDKGLSDKDGENSTWNAYIAMDEANPTQYSLHLVALKDAWYTNAAEWMAKQMQALAGVFCAAAPSVKEQLSTTIAEVCIDKQQKPCTKGAPGCTCTRPATSAQIGVHTFNGWATLWCGNWMEEHAPPPVWEEPVPPQVPPELTRLPLAWWQWGLLATAGIGAGAFLFNRRGS